MKTPTRTRSLMMLLTIALASTPTLAATIFVRANAAPGGNGATWPTAYNNLRLALNAANAGDEVWIARGTYTPDTLLDRGVRFVVKNGVKVYGGFAGNESAITQRPADNDPTAADPAFDTIISGEIGTPAPDDNTINVVDFIPPATASLLDRVVVTRGFNSSGFGAAARISSASPTITNSLFIDNVAGGGAGIFIDVNSFPLIENCVFRLNNVNGSNGGAALIRQQSHPVFRNCSFISNNATGGGAIALAFSGRVTVENSSFTSNTGGGIGGGAIYAVITSQATLRDCTFTSNSGAPSPAASGGGALNFNNSTLLAERCTFTSNSAHQGGVLDNQFNSSSTFKFCTFDQNSATFGGAIAHNSGSLTIEDSLFTTNSGSAGGAIYNLPAFSATRSTFRGNLATTGLNKHGGAIYSFGGGTITDCIFDANRANVGGAFYPVAGTLTLERCTIINHQTGASGGVAFMQGGVMDIRNSLIARNTGSIFGSVAYVSNATMLLTNCTVADNNGGSQAFYAANSGAVVRSRNSILRNPGAEMGGAALLDAAYSNVEGGSPGEGNINVAPVYVNAATSNYRLAAGSPGIDAGNNALVALNTTTDLEGNNRFRDDPATSDTGVGAPPIVDIGAYEFQPIAPAPCIGDADGNRTINFSDITAVLANFGTTYNPDTGPGDADISGTVNFTDITTVLANFGTTCP